MWHTLMLFGILGAWSSQAAEPTPLEENSWALLVAGSNGYWNYRHQADVCHSYHVMISEGIPAKNIIVMMYDDIAYNNDNPTPGIIINRPNGTNVYAGVKIDYSANDVNPTNFLNILQGKKDAMKDIGSGRVIESNEKTNVFVYFADHGGTGLLCFPDGNLMASDFHHALKSMHNNAQYKKLIMYIEACESGSMFDNILEEDTNVYVMTAAARDESSYAWYCEDETCLGDEFSVKWMEHMDKEKPGTLESLFYQFQWVRTQVTKSHVNIYGDFSIGPNKLSPNRKHLATHGQVTPETVDYVDSRDAGLYYFKRKVQSSNNVDSQMKYQHRINHILKGRTLANKMFDEVVTMATKEKPDLKETVSTQRLGLDIAMFDCYKEIIKNFNQYCLSHKHEYIYQHYYKLANICVLRLDTTNLIKEMSSICKPYKSLVRTVIV